MSLRTPLAIAQGLGSAKSGVLHWWMQRLSAVALAPLSLPLILFFNLCFNAPFQETILWLQHPFNSACLVLWIILAFYHAALGLQVVVEDYVAHEGIKIISIGLIKLSFALLAITALLAVIRIIAI